MAISVYTPSADKLLHRTEVDFSKRMVQRTINVVQYDKQLPVVEVKLYVNGEPYILPEEMNAQVRWAKKDRTFTYKSVLGCNAERNTVYFDVDDQMTYYPGNLNPVIELSVIVDEGVLNKGCSQSIPVTIDRNPIQLTDSESEIDFQYMEEILAKMEGYDGDAKNYRDEAEEFKNQASTSAINAANSATSANTSKEQASTSAINAANSAISANTSKEQASTSAINAANSAEEANTALIAINGKLPKLYDALLLTDHNGEPLEDQYGRYLLPEYAVDTYAREQIASFISIDENELDELFA